MTADDRPADRNAAPIGTCPTCGKQSFITRKAAKRWAKNRLPSEHFDAYPCGNYWHYGHLFTGTLRGARSRSDIARRRARRQAEEGR